MFSLFVGSGKGGIAVYVHYDVSMPHQHSRISILSVRLEECGVGTSLAILPLPQRMLLCDQLVTEGGREGGREGVSE